MRSLVAVVLGVLLGGCGQEGAIATDPTVRGSVIQDAAWDFDGSQLVILATDGRTLVLDRETAGSSLRDAASLGFQVASLGPPDIGEQFLRRSDSTVRAGLLLSEPRIEDVKGDVPFCISPDRNWAVVQIEDTVGRRWLTIVHLESGDYERIDIEGGRRVSWQAAGRVLVTDCFTREDEVGFAAKGGARSVVLTVLLTESGELDVNEQWRSLPVGPDKVPLWDVSGRRKAPHTVTMSLPSPQRTTLPSGVSVVGPSLMSLRVVGGYLLWIGNNTLYALPLGAESTADAIVLDASHEVTDFTAAFSHPPRICVALSDGTFGWYEIDDGSLVEVARARP